MQEAKSVNINITVLLFCPGESLQGVWTGGKRGLLEFQEHMTSLPGNLPGIYTNVRITLSYTKTIEYGACLVYQLPSVVKSLVSRLFKWKIIF